MARQTTVISKVYLLQQTEKHTIVVSPDSLLTGLITLNDYGDCCKRFFRMFKIFVKKKVKLLLARVVFSTNLMPTREHLGKGMRHILFILRLFSLAEPQRLCLIQFLFYFFRTPYYVF